MPEELAATSTGLLESPSAVVELALGAVLLLFGRRLFWLLIGALGFAIGLYLAETYLSVESSTWRLVAALACGVLGALAALFLKRLAISLGGALVAGYSTHWYISLSHEELLTWHWLLVAGAVIAGLLLARIVVDIALIGLSTVAGATLLLQSIETGPTLSRWLFLALLILGAVVQGSSLRSKDGSRRAASES